MVYQAICSPATVSPIVSQSASEIRYYVAQEETCLTLAQPHNHIFRIQSHLQYLGEVKIHLLSLPTHPNS